MDDLADILNELPDKLRKEVSIYIHERTYTNIKYLRV